MFLSLSFFLSVFFSFSPFICFSHSLCLSHSSSISLILSLPFSRLIRLAQSRCWGSFRATVSSIIVFIDMNGRNNLASVTIIFYQLLKRPAFIEYPPRIWRERLFYKTPTAVRIQRNKIYLIYNNWNSQMDRSGRFEFDQARRKRLNTLRQTKFCHPLHVNTT